MIHVKLFFLLILLLALPSIPVFAQDRPIVYMLFDEQPDSGQVKMFESATGNTRLYAYSDFSSEIPKRRHFNAVDSSIYRIVDSIYLKQLIIKQPSWHFTKNEDEGFWHDFDSQGNLTDKKSPFKKAFIVEKINDNTFKIIQVVPFMGSIFYAPVRRQGL